MIVTVNSEKETADLATRIQAQLRDDGSPLCVALFGNLGMGKSVFARAFIRAWCDHTEEDVPSPTFTMVQHYENNRGEVLAHFDLYRLAEPDHVYELGWEDALYGGLCLVEWPQRITALLPRPRLDIHFEGADNNPEGRRIRIETIR